MQEGLSEKRKEYRSAYTRYQAAVQKMGVLGIKTAEEAWAQGAYRIGTISAVFRLQRNGEDIAVRIIGAGTDSPKEKAAIGVAAYVEPLLRVKGKQGFEQIIAFKRRPKVTLAHFVDAPTVGELTDQQLSTVTPIGILQALEIVEVGFHYGVDADPSRNNWLYDASSRTPFTAIDLRLRTHPKSPKTFSAITQQKPAPPSVNWC